MRVDRHAVINILIGFARPLVRGVVAAGLGHIKGARSRRVIQGRLKARVPGIPRARQIRDPGLDISAADAPGMIEGHDPKPGIFRERKAFVRVISVRPLINRVIRSRFCHIESISHKKSQVRFITLTRVRSRHRHLGNQRQHFLQAHPLVPGECDLTLVTRIDPRSVRNPRGNARVKRNAKTHVRIAPFRPLVDRIVGTRLRTVES